MSSTYRFLCLSHEPAIVLWGYDLTRDEVTTDSGRSLEALRDHQDCDIVAGRFSSPLVEIGCMGSAMPGPTGCKGYHSVTLWTDRDWLRLLEVATTLAPPVIADEYLRPLLRCWPVERLHRLRGELGLNALESRPCDMEQTHKHLPVHLRDCSYTDGGYYLDGLGRLMRCKVTDGGLRFAVAPWHSYDYFVSFLEPPVREMFPEELKRSLRWGVLDLPPETRTDGRR